MIALIEKSYNFQTLLFPRHLLKSTIISRDCCGVNLIIVIKVQ